MGFAGGVGGVGGIGTGIGFILVLFILLVIIFGGSCGFGGGFGF